MPENIRKQLKDFKEDGKPLKYLINYIPDIHNKAFRM